jgi:hypothetical protein
MSKEKRQKGERKGDRKEKKGEKRKLTVTKDDDRESRRKRK